MVRELPPGAKTESWQHLFSQKKKQKNVVGTSSFFFFHDSSCALFWQLSIERFSICTLVSESVPLPTFPNPASSPPFPSLPPPSRQGSQDSASMLSGEGYHVPIGLDAPQLHTRVSVGQLRSALLQQTGNGAQPEKVYDHLHVCDPDRHYQPVYLCDNICLRLINFFPFLLLLCLFGYQLSCHVLSGSGCETGLRGGPATHAALPPRWVRWRS